MKCGLYTLLFLLIFSASYSQKVIIPKGANRIEITTALSDTALFDMIEFRLETLGFFMDQSDQSKGFMITEFKNMGEEIAIKVVVSIQSNTVIFRGYGEAEVSGNKYTNVPLANKGSGSGVERSGFNQLNELVKKLSKSIGASTITYLAH